MGSLMCRIFHALIVGEVNFLIVSTEILLCELCYDSLHFVLIYSNYDLIKETWLYLLFVLW